MSARSIVGITIIPQMSRFSAKDRTSKYRRIKISIKTRINRLTISIVCVSGRRQIINGRYSQ